MNDNRYCVIMAGGAGNDFWPLGRESRPKAFLSLSSSEKCLLRMTYERFADIIPCENILVVTADRYSALVKETIPELPAENILAEPYSRSTAPCIALAAYTILKRDPEGIMVATPADHVILDNELFRTTIRNVMEYVRDNSTLMTIGIVPDHPDSEYGYIQIAGGKKNTSVPMKVKTFTEKPDEELAKIFFKSGEFYWNSGIFIWKASAIIQEMDKYLPEITSLFSGWQEGLEPASRAFFLEKAYADCPKISIDYGIMEKTDLAWLYPANFRWYDIGSWESLYRNIPHKDRWGNVIEAEKAISEDNSGNLIISSSKDKLIAVKGLEDYLVVDTGDVLLICPRDERSVKDFTSDIAMPGFEKYR